MTVGGTGPLAGVRVLELGGIGPSPFAGMIMADMGADVVRVDRPGGEGIFPGPIRADLLNRGKRSVVLDLKHPGGVTAALSMSAEADILIEGWRPGVAERLGVGPDACHGRNPRLVYGRMTGWGQDGPLAAQAGHDIDYIARTGALHAIGAADHPPQIPLNLVGDFGGGSTYLVMGVLAALFDARRSGTGRIVDAAIVDGVTHLLSGTYSFLAAGQWEDRRGANMLDGGAPYYAVYETADERFVAVGAIESRFYSELLRVLEVDVQPSHQHDRSKWPLARQLIGDRFRSATQAHWLAAFASADACVAPIHSLHEAARDPHLIARGSVVESDGIIQSAPAPRFSGTSGALRPVPRSLGEHTREVFEDWGVVGIEELLAAGAAFTSAPATRDVAGVAE